MKEILPARFTPPWHPTQFLLNSGRISCAKSTGATAESRLAASASAARSKPPDRIAIVAAIIFIGGSVPHRVLANPKVGTGVRLIAHQGETGFNTTTFKFIGCQPSATGFTV